jgi:hypothetical protein
LFRPGSGLIYKLDEWARLGLNFLASGFFGLGPKPDTCLYGLAARNVGFGRPSCIIRSTNLAHVHEFNLLSLSCNMLFLIGKGPEGPIIAFIPAVVYIL